MFKPVLLFISLRYIKAKRSNRFISFIALTSTIGIALGIMTLITVMSVMNGFDREIKTQVFSMVAPLTITQDDGPIEHWQQLTQLAQQEVAELNSAPFVSGQALLTANGAVTPILLNGILPAEESKITAWMDHLALGKINALQPGYFRLIIGQTLAQRLNVQLGDKVTLLIPTMNITPAGIMPRFKRFVVAGIFNIGAGFGFDNSLAFMHLHDAQKLYNLHNTVTGIHLSLTDVFAAPQVSLRLMRQLPEYNVIDWTQQFGAYFHAVSLEKTMMFCILFLIVAVATFNLVATLVMVVNDKSADIAILRTLGATPGMIMMLFILQGGIIGFFGVLCGTISGLLLTWHITALVTWLNNTFQLNLLSSHVYFVDFLPVELLWADVGKIVAIAFSLSLLATIYPAWRAAQVPPVEALRHE